MNYPYAMIEKTIPWPFIKKLLADNKQSEGELFAALDVSKSRYANWKQRGAPMTQAPAIARFLGITIEELLNKEVAPGDAPQAAKSNDLAAAVEMLRIYAALSPDDRKMALELLQGLAEHRMLDSRFIIDNQS